MIAAIGAFDGFHRGHQALLEQAAARGALRGTTWGVVTFKRQSDLLPVFKDARALFTAREQALLEAYFAVPVVHRIDFTQQVAQMTPEAFLDRIAAEFGVCGIVVGEDFRFGKDRVGTPDYLARACRERGWSLDIVPIRRTQAGTPICSTTVRGAVAAGDMASAWELLGYPYFCVERVIHGNERGRRLGYPTANIRIPLDKVDLRTGVYATLVYCDDKWWTGAANVGYNPTFPDVDKRRFEVNLLDYRGNLYDRELPIFLLEHIRDEMRFRDAAELQERMACDVQDIRYIAHEGISRHGDIWRGMEAAVNALTGQPDAMRS